MLRMNGSKHFDVKKRSTNYRKLREKMVTKKRKNSSPALWVRKGKRLVRVGTGCVSTNSPTVASQISKVSSGTNDSHSGALAIHTKAFTSTNILDLPEECIVMIMSFLNPHEICRASTLCKRLFEASKHPRLWWRADFRFVSLLSSTFVVIHPLEVESVLTNAQRRKLFAVFLAKRKAAIRTLLIDFSACEEAGMILNLLESCNVKDLTCVEMRWWKSWDCLVDGQSVKDVKSFQQILDKMSRLCPRIKSLKCEIDLSRKTALLISKFKSIESLSLVFLRMSKGMYGLTEYGLKSSHFAMILSSLPNLENLKIRTRQSIPDEFPGYVLKSSVLKSFDCSWSKCFRICDLDLPNLHTFMAYNNCDFRGSEPCPCLFRLIKKGCPKLRQLNSKQSSVAGLENFQLNNCQMQQMFICSCPEHAPWRENV